jgi:uncharacterized protein (TIGR01777 family)
MASFEFSRVLVTGASGLIGSALVPWLIERGCRVTRLVRGPVSGEGQISWNPASRLAPESVSGFDAVLHLAGESVVGRWSGAKKARIRDSRVIVTRHLAQSLAEAKDRPRVLIAASAVGYYGDRGDQMLDEDSEAGSGFLAEVCREWEAATQPAANAGIRTVPIRIGMVLSSKGGALQKMLPPFRMGAGGKIGSGRQWISWVHIWDLVAAVHHILKTDLLQGPVNMVVPKAVTNAEFTQTLGSVLSRPAILPLPALAAKFAFGQIAEEVLLASQRVEPTKLIASGYPFQYPELRKALESVVKA